MDLVLLRVLSIPMLHRVTRSPPVPVPGVFGALMSRVGWEGCFMGWGGSRPFQWVLGVLESCSVSAAPPVAAHVTQLCPASASHPDLYIPITSPTRRCSRSAKFH